METAKTVCCCFTVRKKRGVYREDTMPWFWHKSSNRSSYPRGTGRYYKTHYCLANMAHVDDYLYSNL